MFRASYKIDAITEEDIELELETLHQGPLREHIDIFSRLWMAGFEIKVSRPKLYKKSTERSLSVRASRGNVLVTWSRKKPSCIVKYRTKGTSGYTIYDEGPGVDGCITDVEEFLTAVPDNDPRMVFDDHEVAHDFLPWVNEKLTWTHQEAAINQVKVIGIFRLYKGIFLSEIKSPDHNKLWFLFSAYIDGQNDECMIAYEPKMKKWCGVMQMRQMKSYKYSLSEIDQQLLEIVIKRYTDRIKEGK